MSVLAACPSPSRFDVQLDMQRWADNSINPDD